jgi:MinD superfamily P-loop ATPase
MRELVVISGKGGTGKTSITASFASLAKRAIICDADVDAADLHLLLKPTILKQSDFKGGNHAIINLDLCSACGTCRELCQFDAIDPGFHVDKIDCEGCGVCVDFCPERAIDFPEKTCGQWFISKTRFGPMVHARLGIAEENSGKLVSLVRQEAKKLAEESNLDWMITDGPPGIGCPVIAAISGATALLIVAEPTVSGIHDMERVARLARGFTIPILVCVNKYDLNPEQTQAIINYANKEEITYLGSIPYDPVVTKSMIEGKTVLEYDPLSSVSQSIEKVWEGILRAPAMNNLAHLEFSYK